MKNTTADILSSEQVIMVSSLVAYSSTSSKTPAAIQ